MREVPINVYYFCEMINRPKEESPCLMEHIRTLESQNSLARGRYIQETLKKLQINSVMQNRRVPRIENIIVDFSPGTEKKRLIITAHYDVVKGSPGANDNASGVSVLLGLCRELKGIQAPVKVVFFDREEAWFRTPVLRLGLLGSLYFKREHPAVSAAGMNRRKFWVGRPDALCLAQGNSLRIYN